MTVDKSYWKTHCVRCGTEKGAGGMWCDRCVEYGPGGKEWNESYRVLAVCMGVEGEERSYRPIAMLHSAFFAQDANRFLTHPDGFGKITEGYKAKVGELVEVEWLSEGDRAHVRKLGGGI